MIFRILLVIVTLAIASAAAYFSVYGLAQLFSGAMWSVVIMGSSIEAGKLVAASFLYRYWTKIGLALKSFLLASVAIVMIVTSVGIFGFLTSAYQKDTLPLQEMEQRIVLLQEEKAELTDRKIAIDRQVESVSANRVLSKDRLTRTFQVERNQIDERLTTVNNELTTLKTDQLNVKAKVGPVMLLAEVFGSDPNKAVLWFILILIVVFDPLAIALTIATNIAFRVHREEQEAKEKQNKFENVDQISLKKFIEKEIKAKQKSE